MSTLYMVSKKRRTNESFNYVFNITTKHVRPCVTPEGRKKGYQTTRKTNMLNATYLFVLLKRL